MAQLTTMMNAHHKANKNQIVIVNVVCVCELQCDKNTQTQTNNAMNIFDLLWLLEKHKQQRMSHQEEVKPCSKKVTA
jgi:hypothetical protein